VRRDPARKLKRERLRRLAEERLELPLEETSGGRIELCSPTAERPFVRQYVPDARAAEPARLRAAGVLDWREVGPTEVPLEDVADRIICADAEAALRRLPAESVTCVITSPPYWNNVDYGVAGQIGFAPARGALTPALSRGERGAADGPEGPSSADPALCSYEEYLDQLLLVWRECERVLEPNGKLCINAPIMPVPKSVLPDQHTRHLKNLANDIEATILPRLSLERFSLYVWQKQTTEKVFGSYPYPPNLFEQNTIEFINVLVKPGPPRRRPAEAKEAGRLTDRQWMNLTRQVWPLFPEDIRRAQHPAPFPEALANRLVALYTFPAVEGVYAGDVVLDPFCGTGATCVAARRLGRRSIGVDLCADFCLAAAERIVGARPDGSVCLVDPQRPRRRPSAGSAQR